MTPWLRYVIALVVSRAATSDGDARAVVPCHQVLEGIARCSDW